MNYKSDLNWIKGVGWTPPGSHKVEMARRAAELGLAEGLDSEQAISKYQELMVRQLLRIYNCNKYESEILYRRERKLKKMNKLIKNEIRLASSVCLTLLFFRCSSVSYSWRISITAPQSRWRPQTKSSSLQSIQMPWRSFMSKGRKPSTLLSNRQKQQNP